MIRQFSKYAAILSAAAGASCTSGLDNYVASQEPLPTFPITSQNLPSTIQVGKDVSGRPVIELNSKVARFAFSKWKSAREEAVARQGSLAASSNFADWEKANQNAYRAQLEALLPLIPYPCPDDNRDCHPEVNAKAAPINRNYQPSEALLIWQLNHYAKAYVSILMDEELVAGMRRWKELNLDERLRIANKLVEHQLDAFFDGLDLHPYPKVQIDPNLGRGAQHSIKKNLITLPQGALAHSPLHEITSVLGHEAGHGVQRIVGEMLNSPQGMEYLNKFNLKTETMISVANIQLYSFPQRDFGAYECQSREWGVRFGEAMGFSLPSIIASMPAGQKWTPERALGSFYQALDLSPLAHKCPKGINFEAVGDLARFVGGSTAMYGLFSKTLEKDGEVCVRENLSSKPSCVYLTPR